MEEAQQPMAVNRKKRVQRLKKMIIYGLVIGITVPWILCVVLLSLTLEYRRQSMQLNEKVAQFTGLIGRQQEQMQTQYDSLLQELSSERQERQALEEALRDQAAQVAAEEEQKPEELIVTKEDVHKVYLTFDDGPSIHTNEILDILQAYDVKATFFVLGKEGEASEQALQRIVEEGHSLGMHSYSHQYDDIYSSREAFAADFERIRDYLFRVTGVTSRLYRFPGGSSNTVTNTDIHEFIDYLAEQDTVYFDWNVASGDAAKISLSAKNIVENATRGIENRAVSVILFHDAAGRETTVEALPAIIERIRAMKNTEFLPITEETELVQHVKTDK